MIKTFNANEVIAVANDVKPIQLWKNFAIGAGKIAAAAAVGVGIGVLILRGTVTPEEVVDTVANFVK